VGPPARSLPAPSRGNEPDQQRKARCRWTIEPSLSNLPLIPTAATPITGVIAQVLSGFNQRRLHLGNLAGGPIRNGVACRRARAVFLVC